MVIYSLTVWVRALLQSALASTNKLIVEDFFIQLEVLIENLPDLSFIRLIKAFMVRAFYQVNRVTLYLSHKVLTKAQRHESMATLAELSKFTWAFMLIANVTAY